MANSFPQSPLLLVEGFIFVDVITSYLAVRSFVRCAMMALGGGAGTVSADRSDVPTVTLPVRQ